MRLLAALMFCFAPAAAFASFDDPARFAFLSSHSDESIIVIDLYDREKAGKIELTEAPDAVTASEALKAVIVSHRDANKLTLIDLTSDIPVQIEYPLGIRPDLVLVSPIGETVAVLDRTSDTLEVHALKRRKVLVTVEGVRTDTPLTFGPDGSIVYWVDAEQGMLHSADLWSNRRELKLAGAGDALSAMTRSVDGTLGFVSNARTGAIHVVDLRSFRIAQSRRVGTQPTRAWGTADGQYMIVPDAETGAVAALSASTGDLLYSVKAATDPASINPGWIDTIAAVVARSGDIIFLSIDNGAELSRVALGANAEAGIVTSDSKTLAVPVPGKGSMAIFDMQRQELVANIEGLPTDIGPASLAVSNNLCH